MTNSCPNLLDNYFLNLELALVKAGEAPEKAYNLIQIWQETRTQKLDTEGAWLEFLQIWDNYHYNKQQLT